MQIVFGQPQTRQILHEEDREVYNQYFEQAGSEFGVPSDILRGISFAETRWTHMKWAEDDKFSSCTGMPRVYGVMGLWDNDYFGHSLKEAALLIDKTPQELKESPLENIRGAAALLKKYYSELPKLNDVDDDALENWHNAIVKFNGIPQEELATRRSLEIYSILSTGYSRDRIMISKKEVDVEMIRRIVRKVEIGIEIQQKTEGIQKTQNTPDYPLAKWNAAYSGNFGTQLIQQKFVVVHDVEGSYLGCISWFKNTTAEVSAHYVLNSHPNGVTNKLPNSTPDAPVGEVTQMVEEKYRAWHVGCWNSYMIGIEHEGYAGVSGWYTPECYTASSKLVNYLCEKYNIPKDRNHVIAHSEHQNTTWRNWVNTTSQGFDPTCNTHTDPGIYWNWTTFMNLVTIADTITPQIQSVSHSNLKLYPTYKEISVSFNTSMDINSTNSAFTITPTVAGTKTWNTDNTVLMFKSTSNFAFNSSYTIKIDTTAKNIALKKTLGPSPYVITFTTVPIDTVGPTILQVYPYNNAANVPTKPEVWLKMSDVVQTTSLSSTLKFVDINNASVSMSGAKNEVVDDLGIISFFPTLKPNQSYIVKLFPGLKDMYNNLSTDTVMIQFKTEPYQHTTPGIILDQFESNGRGWGQPNQSAGSLGIDTAFSKFYFSPDKKLNGTTSGKLSYKFSNSSNGVADIAVSSMPLIDSYSSLGMWVYGDMNFHTVKLHFAPNNQVIDLGRIHWRGWKFISVPLTSITGPSKKMISLSVVQDSSVSTEGALFFDDMQLDAVINGVQNNDPIQPEAISLGQNYPNPFNPTTLIPFSITKQLRVSIKIFDILGREVMTVLNEVRSAGENTIIFDAHHLPSGVYYYSIIAGEYTQSRKMVLLK